jgi:hypothetical protein
MRARARAASSRRCIARASIGAANLSSTTSDGARAIRQSDATSDISPTYAAASVCSPAQST